MALPESATDSTNLTPPGTATFTIGSTDSVTVSIGGGAYQTSAGTFVITSASAEPVGLAVYGEGDLPRHPFHPVVAPVRQPPPRVTPLDAPGVGRRVRVV